MLVIVFVSITATVVAIPSIGLLMLADVILNPSLESPVSKETIGRRLGHGQSKKIKDAGVLIAG